MNDESLMALSSLDGRYLRDTSSLRSYFSEFAFMKYRMQVELRYLLFLSEQKIIRKCTSVEKSIIKHNIDTFSLSGAKRIKVFESETKHDVKALEYYIKEIFVETSLADVLPYVHFGLTSEDVNNLAYGMMLTQANKEVLLPELSACIKHLSNLSIQCAQHVMLGRTHGQPAVPTTFGKEIAVYISRLKKLEKQLRRFRIEGKCNGAVGNYNALYFAYAKVDWLKYSQKFVANLGLVPNLVTTQILPADNLVEYMQLVGRINTVFLSLSQDMWSYISRGLVGLKKDEKQVGSSTMPQKINPIDFENAEGNVSIANTYIELYARKLPVSRLQRDLSDSTVKRTMGTALGHTLLAWKSIVRGLEKISFDVKVAEQELDEHWEVLGEAIQIYMKMQGDSAGYEKVKAMMMGKKLDAKTFRTLAKKFPTLAKLTPSSYIGLAEKLTTL